GLEDRWLGGTEPPGSNKRASLWRGACDRNRQSGARSYGERSLESLGRTGGRDVNIYRRGSLNSEGLFGLSILMCFLAFALVTKVYIWPRIRVMRRTDALIPLVIPHTFRFVGLSFLIPGVVSPSLSPAFSIPAAYGDLVAAILAGVATLALAARLSWA